MSWAPGHQSHQQQKLFLLFKLDKLDNFYCSLKIWPSFTCIQYTHTKYTCFIEINKLCVRSQIVVVDREWHGMAWKRTQPTYDKQIKITIK